MLMVAGVSSAAPADTGCRHVDSGVFTRGICRRGTVASVAIACAFAFWASTNAWSASFDCLIEPSLTLKLGSPITSILDKVEVDRGDLVKEGQVIARLESAVEQAVVAVNEAHAGSTASR
jgi:multidrug efflux pump subunit AcrA (membrane-fusion protein)